MFIPAKKRSAAAVYPAKFQSRDWVDVYSGTFGLTQHCQLLMFQSRDWVDVYSGFGLGKKLGYIRLFQSRDWVDVYSGAESTP